VESLNLDGRVDVDSARVWRHESTTERCASAINRLAEAGVDPVLLVPLTGRDAGVVDDVLENLLPIVGDWGA
jgi:hypothetical protein